jgi:hypothetical protein
MIGARSSSDAYFRMSEILEPKIEIHVIFSLG